MATSAERLEKLEGIVTEHVIQTAVRYPGDGPSLWPGHCPACGMDLDDQATMIVCDTCYNKALDVRFASLAAECSA